MVVFQLSAASEDDIMASTYRRGVDLEAEVRPWLVAWHGSVRSSGEEKGAALGRR